jgi:flagellar M-ring protein FliF
VSTARNLLANMDPRGRAILAGAVLGTLLVAFLLFRVAAQPSYAPLLSGLNPADTGKVTAVLDAQGIAYELRNNGTALAVRKEDAARARIAVAEHGLPSGGKAGFELFDQQKLGTSDFQQKVTYERALQGEIGRTIEQIDGVSGAQVELVLPQDELFSDQQSAAKAAVLLSGDGTALQPGAVRGMAQLVASSVRGLTLSNVTITDGAGRLLWPSGQDGVSGATGKQAVQARYERTLEDSINAMLASTYGPGKALVHVNADLNTDRATQDRLVYDKHGIALHTEGENEKLKGAGGGKPASGSGANIPSYAQGAAGGGNSNYDRRTRKADYALGKTVTRTQIAPGKVNRLQVALMADQSIPRAQLAGMRAAVAAAAGIDPTRGDKVTLATVPFAGLPALHQPQGSPVGGILPLAKWVALGLALLAFLLFLVRHLRRREQETLGDPDWLLEHARPVSVAELAAGRPAPEMLPSVQQEPIDTRLTRVREAAERNPERIAQQVSLWLQED